jgi:hypothetical protein
MRAGIRFLSSSAQLAIAIIVTVAALATGEARDASQCCTETGVPTWLINRPVCGTGEAFDEWPLCPMTGPGRSLID